MSKRRRKLFDDDSKVYKICSVLGGLDVTRYVSAHTRQLFQGAIEDVELIREYVSQSASERNNKAKPYDMDKMAHTFQWKRRGFDSPTTSIEAGQGYVDDSPDRSIEACFLQNKNHPLVGTQASDMAMIHTVSYLFPWIVDRRSKEGWIRHQNGRSDTQPLLFDTLYTAAWIGTYGEAWAYYPPFRVFDDHHPLNLIDVMGNLLDTHDLPFVKPNLPSVGNNNRKAFFRNPYPDTAQLGLSLISALAPVYYTGKFGNNTYNDTYIASTGVDIPVSSVSSLLDVLRDRLTQDSFAILVDSDFNTIVISQEVVERIYPRRTGFEESRVSYDTRDGSMIGDRRNQTYLVSDTIFQPLTSLTNANWTGLLDFIREDVRRGDRDYSTLNITLTSEKEPTEFYVMLERWKYVADWILLSFAPTHQVEHAIDVSFSTTNDNSLTHEQHSNRIYLAGERGHPLSGQAMIVNSGTMDVRVGIKNIPRCIQFQNKTQMLEKESLTAGNTLPLEFHIRTDDLELGVSSMLLAFSVQDDQYPDCFYNQDLNLEVVVRVTPIDCVAATGIQRLVWSEAKHNCVCQRDTIPVSGGYCLSYFLVLPIVLVVLVVLGLIGVHVYVEQKRQQADSVWAVKTAELQFDDPPEVVGRGTFGLVLLAEYRGTQVAVKRVIPPQEQRKEKRGKVKNRRNSANYFDMQAEKTSSGEYSIVEDGGLVSSNNLASGRMTRSKRRTSRRSSMRNSNAEYARLKNEFTYEMRLLSKLRHPCITTVMGAVISEDPLLVMEYMDHGSLFDLLHNETMIIEGDIVLPILRDIAQGVRFLHAAEPQVIHGDLKAQNVLVDGKFRAKVTDFGLSQKKQVGVAGTPLWMAPELLRGESNNSAASDGKFCCVQVLLVLTKFY